MPELTLYRANNACSLAVNCVLRELSIPFTTIVLKSGPDGSYEAADGSFTHAEYRRTVNPAGYVPALKIDDEFLTETPALFAYITSLTPSGARLLDAEGDDLGRFRVVSWLNWLSGTLHGRGFGMVFRPARFTDDAAQHKAVREKGQEFVKECFEKIEASLRGKEKKFLVGKAETVADFYVLVFWRWGVQIGIPMADLYPSFGELAKGIEMRDSVRAAVEEEGLTMTFPTA